MAEDAHKVPVLDLEPGARVEGDPELLAQLLISLIENAIAHTGEGSTISISLRRSGQRAELKVADNGPDVPPQEPQYLFKRCHRLEGSRSSPGNGLGLSLVEAIATLHSLRIHATDGGPGLCITATFNPI